MQFALSTRWNAGRHSDGEPLLEEIVEQTGLTHVELGYDLTLDLVPGVQSVIESGAVTVDSVHNYCPVPIGAPQGHPELFVLASHDARIRESAIQHTQKTIAFAAEIGAKAVVCHAGNVDMKRRTHTLIKLCYDDRQYGVKYEKIKTRMLLDRDKKVGKHIDHLCNSVDELIPTLEDAGVALAFENLPSWESIPTEAEMETLARRYDSPCLRYWHDFGHGQVRHTLGLVSHLRWVEKLQPWLVGCHIHDVNPPAYDHLMPPEGAIDFAPFAPLVPEDALRVFEPAPHTPGQVLREGIETVRQAWSPPEKGAKTGETG